MNTLTSTLSFLLKLHKINKLAFFILLIQFPTYSQEYSLEITSTNKPELKELEKIKYVKKHSSRKSIDSEILKIRKDLNSKGFLKISHDFKKHDSIFTYTFKLGNKVNLAVIKKGDSKLILAFKELETYLIEQRNKFDRKGESFTETKLSNIRIRKDTLFAELVSDQTKVRSINKIIIKGYEDFPKPYLKYFLNISEKTNTSKEKLRNISKQIKTIEFVKETKAPQLLFSKDSTFLFLYIKKKSKNYFDGFINASPSDNSIKINGQLSLGLTNIFNGGESFNINWNSNSENTSFNANTQIPYLFNSPITPELSFNIFKQDSSFLNSELKTKLSYQLSQKSRISINYQTTSSSNLTENQRIDLSSFSNTFYGLSFKTILKNKPSDFLENSYLSSLILFGSRNTEDLNVNQFKFSIHTQHFQRLSKKGSLLLKAQLGYLESKTYLENELFRIGGPLSIRGFLPNSIPAAKFALLKTQYNYLINEKTQLYPLLDIARYNFNETNDLISTGIGYSQLRNNTLINIEYAIGKSNKQKFDFNNSFLSVKILTYF